MKQLVLKIHNPTGTISSIGSWKIPTDDMMRSIYVHPDCQDIGGHIRLAFLKGATKVEVIKEEPK